LKKPFPQHENLTFKKSPKNHPNLHSPTTDLGCHFVYRHFNANLHHPLLISHFRTAWICIFDRLSLLDTLHLFSVSSYFNNDTDNNFNNCDDLWNGWGNTLLWKENKVVQENWDVCASCDLLFLPDKNHDTACNYHVGPKYANGWYKCCSRRIGCMTGRHKGRGISRNTKVGCRAIFCALETERRK